MATAANPTRDDFAKMLDEQLGGADDGGFEGRVVKGTVTAIENGMALIDVGLKSEGRVDLREFMRNEDEHGLEVGSEVEVYVDRVENADGEAMLSRDRARRGQSRMRAGPRGRRADMAVPTTIPTTTNDFSSSVIVPSHSLSVFIPFSIVYSCWYRKNLDFLA